MTEFFHEYYDKLFMVAWVIFMMCVVRWAFAVKARHSTGEPK